MEIDDYNAITTLERVKDRIAKKEGFDTWRDLTFKVNGLSVELIMDKVAEEYASLKVAEATLPNVEDWDEVEKEFMQLNPNFDSYIFDWLKQHYSTPLSASEQSPEIDDIIHKYILDTTLIDSKKPQEIGDALRVSEINQAFRKGLSLSPQKVSEQSPKLSDEQIENKMIEKVGEYWYIMGKHKKHTIEAFRELQAEHPVYKEIMYKVDLKTLNEITETLDILSNVQKSTMAEFIKATEKAKNLSQKIKDEYTQIK